MGLFENKKNYEIDQQVFALGKDMPTEEDIIRSAVVSSIVGGSSSIGMDIATAIKNAPGIKLRKAFKSTVEKHPTMLLDGHLSHAVSVEGTDIHAAVETALGITGNQTVQIQRTWIDAAHPDYMIEFFMERDHPEIAPDSYEVYIVGDYVGAKVPNGSGYNTYQYGTTLDFRWSDSNGSPLLWVQYYVVDNPEETDPEVELAQSELRLFTYRIGSGNATFDALWNTQARNHEFFPVLPVWKNGNRIDEESESVYNAGKYIYKKAFGSRFGELVDGFASNEDADKIDYAYLLFGVPLNTDINAGREYIFEFFRYLSEAQHPYSLNILDSFRQARAYQSAYAAWEQYRNLDREGREVYRRINGNYVPPLPKEPDRYTVPYKNQFGLQNETSAPFRARIDWTYIRRSIRYGNGARVAGNSGAMLKQGDVRFYTAAPFEYAYLGLRRWRDQGEAQVERNYLFTGEIPRIYMVKQTGALQYECLEIVGLEYNSRVVKSQYINLEAYKHIGQSSDPNGFIIPLNDPVMQRMGLKKINNFANSTAILVANSYTVRETKWYEAGWFRAFISIAVSVVAALATGGAGLAAGAGILGSNLAVGAALGFSSTMAAAVAGAVANGIAAAVVTTLVQKASSAMFGEKLGAVVGTLAMFFAINAAANFIDAGNIGLNLTDTLKPENLMKLTSSVGDAYTKWMNADTMGLQQGYAEMAKGYQEEFKAIQEAHEALLGDANGIVDPMMFTELGSSQYETAESFLSRTLLTGSDIAELSDVIITEFTEMNLRLPGIDD